MGKISQEQAWPAAPLRARSGPLPAWLKRLYRTLHPGSRSDGSRLRCGNFEIEAPPEHILPQLQPTQPFRDLNIGIAAKYLGAKYPGATLVDVGANIGDTAAMMATHASNPLLLIEGSDYFFAYLQRNAARLPNETRLHNCLIGDGKSLSGNLQYWGGTAYFVESPGAAGIATRTLSEVAGDTACFVKIDTDGFDFRIIAASLSWLARVQPGVLFENTIRKLQDLQDAEDTFARLADAGYAHYVVWDDTGLHMLSTSSLREIADLNRYLYKIWSYDGRRSIYNYDVLCLSERDRDVYDLVTCWYRLN
ncbi:MAG TPA: FkbM family methyltransferase [Nevskiales bacterium]|nr:FkbM family methyltransferase [Nevskiales bacterium]